MRNLILLLKFNMKRSAGCVIYELISLERFANIELISEKSAEYWIEGAK
jgi:hypothetical protein